MRIVALLATALLAACPEIGAVAQPVDFDAGVERTESRRARGEYLVNGILWCFQCHSEPDVAQAGHPPKKGRMGAGRVYSQGEGRRLVAPNLTADVASGIGGFSDAQLARAIRQGIGHDGRRLRAMPAQSFGVMTDEDLASVIVYLRSLQPVPNALPENIPANEKNAQRASEPLISLPERTEKSAVDRGRYLIELADCVGCHTAWMAPRMPGVLAGGNEMKRAPGTFSSNLTVHDTGIGYGADAFVRFMQTGKLGTLHPEMPWAAFRNVSEPDLRSIYAALATIPATAHFVSNHAEATACEVCGQHHGGGSANRLVVPESDLTLPAALLDAYAGTYYNERFDMGIDIVRKGQRLEGRAGPWAFVLVAQTDDFFLAPGFLSPIRFERSGNAPAHRLVTVEIIETPFPRIEAAAARP